MTVGGGGEAESHRRRTLPGRTLVTLGMRESLVVPECSTRQCLERRQKAVPDAFSNKPSTKGPKCWKENKGGLTAFSRDQEDVPLVGQVRGS